jgi:hypothetical protein
MCRIYYFTWEYTAMNVKIQCSLTGFPLYLEIRENLENDFHFFQSGKNQGIRKIWLISGKNQGILKTQDKMLPFL